MACNVGQRLEDQFDRAVAVRAQLETGKANGAVLMEAKIKESSALQRRSYHVRDCAECWVSPPRRRQSVTYEGLMARLMAAG